MISTAITVIKKDQTCLNIVSVACIIGAAISTLLFQTALEYDWYWSVLAIVWVAGVYLMISYVTPASFKMRRCDKELKDVKGQFLPLFEKENQMLEVYSPTILHVFDASALIGSDEEEKRDRVLDWIRARAKVIAEQNPYLLGRLRCDSNNGSFPGTWIPNGDDDAAKKFREETFKNLFWREVKVENEETGFNRENIAKESIVKCGLTILDDPKEPVAKMTLLISKRKFALVFSQSHLMGDSHSMYKIFNMFNPGEFKTDEDIIHYDVPRSTAYDKKIHHLEFEGKQHLKKFAFLAKEYMLGAMLRVVLPYLGGRTYEGDVHEAKATHRYYSLRKDWIDQEKKKYQRIAIEQSVEYHQKRADDPKIAGKPVTKKQKQFEEEFVNIKISSNDVLVKFLFENLWNGSGDKKRKFGMFMIAFEFRSRFIRAAYLPQKPLPDSYLGNYFELMLFNRDEIADSLKIRRLVNSKGRSSEIDLDDYDQKDLIPETAAENLCRQVPIIINNTRFYQEFDFSSVCGSVVKTEKQVPLMFSGKEIGDKNLVMNEPTAVIYRVNDAGDLGLYVYGDEGDCKFEKVDEAPLNGEVVV